MPAPGRQSISCPGTPLACRTAPRVKRRMPRRGSVLIVALLLAALIAVSLGSYLNVNLTSSRLSKRTFHGYAALNLAEAGAEEGVWAFNRATSGDSAAWNGWTAGSGAAWQKFSNFDYGANTSGWVKVYVDNTNPSANAQPKIITQASIGQEGDMPSTKMLEVTLRRRSYFAGGLVAKDSVAFSGSNASVDSWDSDPDNSTATAAIPYSAAVRTDRGSVATTAFVNTAAAINNASIWGYVATGGSQPQVGSNGSIRGVTTPADVAVDPTRISTDFSADFPAVSAPVGGTPILTLGSTLGVAGTATKWRTPGITLSGNESLTIYGDVTLILTAGSGADAISVTGNAQIIVPKNSTLTVYVEGNVKLGGNGLANANVQPVSCQIWGVNQTIAGQEIQIAGNGALVAIIYAPGGDVKINGNGSVMGAVVANRITLVGNAEFHYDESLARRETNEPFTIRKWRELTTQSDRAPYNALFQGW
jgi:Tfp pilus assembly protein PilX